MQQRTAASATMARTTALNAVQSIHWHNLCCNTGFRLVYFQAGDNYEMLHSLRRGARDAANQEAVSVHPNTWSSGLAISVTQGVTGLRVEAVANMT